MRFQVLDVLGEELPCIRYDGWGNLTPSGYFKFDLGEFRNSIAARFYVVPMCASACGCSCMLEVSVYCSFIVLTCMVVQFCLLKTQLGGGIALIYRELV